MQHARNEIVLILDFDRTVTSYWYEKEKKLLGMSSYGVLENYENGFGKSYVMKSKELFDLYHSVEVDEKVGYEEKFQKMVEWWMKAHDLIIQTNITLKDIVDAVKVAKYKIREGVRELFDVARENNIPILIFSAGLKDVIEAILVQERMYFPQDEKNNIFIISNNMVFSKDGKQICIGFADDIIHVLNKGATAMSTNILEKIPMLKSRKNVILVGDHEGDAKMADNIIFQNVYRFGLLNVDFENQAKLEIYHKVFDEVLVDDASLKPVVDFVLTIINQ